MASRIGAKIPAGVVRNGTEADLIRRRADACLVCEACGGIHHENDKARLMETGEWCATRGPCSGGTRSPRRRR